jgi:hypothetical protein
VAGTSPDLDAFQKAFALARTRSVERSAVSENQAAIFALGILLGHPRLEEFLGPVLDDRGFEAACQALYRVRIRDRSDWTKHFCVSAALALLSDAVVSDAAGLFKEELDAGAGGSGFSFADLLADRRATFALTATRDEAAAPIRDRLAGHVDSSSRRPIFQKIPDAELQAPLRGRGKPIAS